MSDQNDNPFNWPVEKRSALWQFHVNQLDNLGGMATLAALVASPIMAIDITISRLTDAVERCATALETIAKDVASKAPPESQPAAESADDPAIRYADER